MAGTTLQKRNIVILKLCSLKERLRILLINIIHFHLLFSENKSGRPLPRGMKLLLINTGDLGDNVLTFKFIESALLDKNCKVWVLSKKQYLELYTSLNQGVNFILWDKVRYKWNLFYKIRILKQLRSELFDLVLNVTPERGVLNEELVLFSGANVSMRIIKSDSYICRFYKKILNEKYSFTYRPGTNNEYDILHKLRFNIEFSSLDQKDHPLRLPNGKYISIAPFASDPKRSWEEQNFKKICEVLGRSYKVYVLGVSKSKIFDQLDRKNVVNLTGRTTLTQIFHILKNTSLFIGNDSGLTHLALYLNVPLLAISGGGMFNRFFPSEESDITRYLYKKMDCFGCSWNCIYTKRHCISEVKVNQVLDTAFKFLNGSNAV